MGIRAQLVRAATVAATMFVMSMSPTGAAPEPLNALGTNASPLDRVLPAPESSIPLPGETFELTAASTVVVPLGDAEAAAVGERFAARLRRATGFVLPVTNEPSAGAIVLTLAAHEFAVEGYSLRVDSNGVTVRAGTNEGLFRGLTTLRQLLPPAAEAPSVQPGPWTVAGVEITDAPRFAYRGAMLDVARHFFAVDDVLHFVDLISLYKVNHLHLHLSDDQGWRISVQGWPRLTEVGGPSDVDGGPGGFYTADDYARIVTYAAEHFVRVVPEIDGPGHASAALIAYPELSCDGAAPPPFQQRGISEVSLCADKESTYTFLGDVFDSLAAADGAFIHIGGDEAIGTAHEDFMQFVHRTSVLVVERRRRPIVWHEAAQATLPPGTVVQYWGVGQDEATDLARRAIAQGAELILSPGNRAYLDMKYDEDTPFGLTWAGTVPVSVAYDWDPATLIDGVREESIIGVEAALWTETTADRAAVEYMVFPRLAGIAEIAWSPAAAHDWDGHRLRLAAQAPRWDALGINYFRSPEVPWPE